MFPIIGPIKSPLDRQEEKHPEKTAVENRGLASAIPTSNKVAPIIGPIKSPLDRRQEGQESDQVASYENTGNQVSAAEFLGLEDGGAYSGRGDISAEEFLSSAPSKEMGLVEAATSGFKTGQLQLKLADLGYQLLTGNESPEIYKKIEETKEKAKEIPEAENWLSWALQSGAEFLPMMGSSVYEGLKTGAITGMGFGAIAAAAGQAGPQMFTPEEIYTVPISTGAGLAVGSVHGAANRAYELEAGLALVDLLDSGIDPTVARYTAAAIGGVNALLEVSQIGDLLKTFPGGEKAIRKLVRESVVDILKSPGVKKQLAKLGAKHAKHIGKETTQEVLQETANIVGEHFAGKVSNYLKDTDVEPQTREEIINRLSEVAKKSAVGFAVLNVPGAAVGTKRAIGTGIQEAKAEQLQQFLKEVEGDAVSGQDLEASTEEAATKKAESPAVSAEEFLGFREGASSPLDPLYRVRAINQEKINQVESDYEATVEDRVKKAQKQRQAIINRELNETPWAEAKKSPTSLLDRDKQLREILELRKKRGDFLPAEEAQVSDADKTFSGVVRRLTDTGLKKAHRDIRDLSSKKPAEKTYKQALDILEEEMASRFIPVTQPVEEKIAAAEKEVDTSPTEAQKVAGNYKKGHISLNGLRISIEQPAGSVRSGIDSRGKPWKTEMKNPYGYIIGTKGKDHDNLDVFIGPNPESQKAYIVDQRDPNTGKFDEHKIVLGAKSKQEARKIYEQNYEKGWDGLQAISEVSIDELKEWAKKPGARTAPFSKLKDAEVSYDLDYAKGKAQLAPKKSVLHVSDEDIYRQFKHADKIEKTGKDSFVVWKGDKKLRIVGQDYIAVPQEVIEEAYSHLPTPVVEKAVERGAKGSFLHDHNVIKLKRANLSKNDFDKSTLAKMLSADYLNPLELAAIKTAAAKGLGIKKGEVTPDILSTWVRDRLEKWDFNPGSAAGNVMRKIAQGVNSRADRYTLHHETFHWMRREGFVGDKEADTLKRAMVRVGEAESVDEINEEMLTKWVETRMAERDFKASTPAGRILQALVDFVDTAINAVRKAFGGTGSAAGIVRDVQTGKALKKKPGKTTAPTSEMAKISSEVDEFRKEKKLGDVRMTKSGGHPTQITSTANTYKKIKPLLKEGKTLDYGAGRNIGKVALGADTFEPYPVKGITPTYKDSKQIPDASYDNVVSNAVLNVVPDDVRDSIVKDIGRILRPGGKAFINVRGRDVLDAKGIEVIDRDNLEVIIKSNGAYQKGFRQKELTDYLRKTLGPGFSVKSAGDQFGTVSAVVEKALQAEGEFDLDTLAWPEDFPDATIHTSFKHINNKYKDLHARGKAGDEEAADMLVEKTIKPERIKALAKKHPDAVLRPIVAVESSGTNKIPWALAQAASDIGGFDYEPLIQINKPKRTGSSGIHRLTERPWFSGDVTPGQEYILVDDAITQGGTLSEARRYITTLGGKVVDTMALTASKGSTKIALSSATQNLIERKFGHAETEAFLREYGIAGSLRELTENEGRYLAKFGSLDAARDRLADRGVPRLSKAVQRTLFPPQVAATKTEYDLDIGPRFRGEMPDEGTISPGEASLRNTRIAPATSTAQVYTDITSTSGQELFFKNGIRAIEIKDAVEAGYLSADVGAVLDSLFDSFPKAFRERYRVLFSPDKVKAGGKEATSALAIEKWGKLRDDARHVLALFQGGSVYDAIYGFGRFIYDRALTRHGKNSDVSLVKKEFKKAKQSGDAKGMDTRDWFARKFVDWWFRADPSPTPKGIRGIFRKIVRALKNFYMFFKETDHLPRPLKDLFNDIVTNGRDIQEKYFYTDAEVVEQYFFGVTPSKEDYKTQGFKANSKTGLSWNPGSMCPKQEVFANYVRRQIEENDLQIEALANPDVIAGFYDQAVADGIDVPCSYCYVEGGRRRAIAAHYSGKPIGGVNFTMAKKAIRTVPYKDQILRWSQDKIDRVNRYGGLRMFSFSDYIQPAHRVEVEKLLKDAEKRGLSIKAITKTQSFIDDFADTGIVINQSIDAMDAKFGIDWEQAALNKERYPNVFVRITARNENEVDRALKLKYRVKNGRVEFLDAWNTNGKTGPLEQHGLPTTRRKDYEKRLKEKGWKNFIDVVTPYHHEGDGPVPENYSDMAYNKKAGIELKKWADKHGHSDRLCCMVGGKCWSDTHGQCKTNCGLGVGNLAIPQTAHKGVDYDLDLPSFSASESTVWYSDMQNFLEKKLSNKGTAKSFALQLKSWAKKGEFKQEELDWSGLIPWLEEQEGKVSKQDIMDYLAANNLQVEEKEFVQHERTREPIEDEAYRLFEEEFDRYNEYFFNAMQGAYKEAAEEAWSDENHIVWDSLYNNRQIMGRRTKQDFIEEANGDEKQAFSDFQDEVLELDFDEIMSSEDYVSQKQEFWKDNKYGYIETVKDKRALDIAMGSAEAPTTKYHEYQLPGGENYRELLITLPRRKAPQAVPDTTGWTVEVVDDSVYAYTGQRHIIVRDADGNIRGQRSGFRGTDEEAIREFAANQQRAATDDAERLLNFKSSHFNEPNILAHVRFNERTGPNGEQVLFLEEVQSDWHQEGRKTGYRQKGKKRFTREESQAYQDDIFARFDRGEITREQRNEELSRLSEMREKAFHGVPDAPFKTTWPMLVMKRMVRYAAENGYDAVAWHATPETLRQTEGWSTLEQNERGQWVADEHQDVTPIVERYLTRLPQEVNKFFNKKKWGKAKIGEISLDYVGKAHALPITPEIRSRVVSEGLPLFDLDIDPIVAQQTVNSAPAKNESELGKKIMTEYFGRSHETLGDKIMSALQAVLTREFWSKATTNWVDRLHPIRELIGEEPYRLHRLATGTQGQFAMLLLHGKLAWDRSGVPIVTEQKKGFIRFLHSIGDDWHKFLYWVAARRAEEIEAQDRARGLTPDDKEWRERWLPKSRRKEIYKWAGGRDNKRFEQANKVLQYFNKSVLDFAQQAGLIDAESRQVWEQEFYVPFYRLFEDPELKEEFLRAPKTGGKMITSGIKKLRGREQKVGDPLENLLKNWMHLIHESNRNVARRNAYETALAMGTGVVEEASIKDVKRFFYAKDKKTIYVSEKTNAPILQFLEDGKAKYFRVNDIGLYHALADMNTHTFDNLFMSLARGQKRLLTWGATITPAFRIANFFRDTLHSALIEKSFVPFIDSAIGFWSSLTEDEHYIKFMASGAGFGSSYLHAQNPHLAAEQIKRIRKSEGAGAVKYILDTPRKMLDFWEKIGTASENAARVGLYRRMTLKHGESHFDASFRGRDLLDFTMRGESRIMQFLIQTIPFLNARVHGLYKLGNAATNKETRKNFWFRGMMMAAATIALWSFNKDREEWKELEDWDKNSYFHFWIGDVHIRIPKPFEVGAIFGSGIEQIADTLHGNEDIGGVWDFVAFTIRQTFALDLPQFWKPIHEQLTNRNAFTGRRIVGMDLQRLEPEEQADPWTSEFAQLIGDAWMLAPKEIRERVPEVLRSPKRLEALVRAYTAGLGMYVLGGADWIVTQMFDFPEQPAWSLRDYPVIGRFVASAKDPARHTKYTSWFYDVYSEMTKAMNQARDYAATGKIREFKDYASKNKKNLMYLSQFRAIKKQINDANRELEKILLHKKMTPKEKRKAINEITRYKNSLMQKAYDTYGDILEK